MPAEDAYTIFLTPARRHASSTLTVPSTFVIASVTRMDRRLVPNGGRVVEYHFGSARNLGCEVCIDDELSMASRSALDRGWRRIQNSDRRAPRPRRLVHSRLPRCSNHEPGSTGYDRLHRVIPSLSRETQGHARGSGSRRRSGDSPAPRVRRDPIQCQRSFVQEIWTDLRP